MRIAIGFDGTIVHGDPKHAAFELRLGAVEALRQMRAAGHELLLCSDRANRAALYDPSWDPVVRAGHRRAADRWVGEGARELAWRRYRQMIGWVDRELPGIFVAVDDGLQGPPVVDRVIDARAGKVDWAALARELGEPWAPSVRVGPKVIRIEEGSPYRDVRHSVTAARHVWPTPLVVHPYGWTSRIGPILAVEYEPAGETPIAKVAIIAGQHGEEQAGVAAICNRWPELLELARNWKMRLRVYPCANPEGFDKLCRHNDRRQEPTNAALEYEIAPGVWKGEVNPGTKWLSTRRCAQAADESRWLVNDLEGFRPDVLLDLHGDSDVPGGGAFAYTFGPREPYAEGMRRSGAAPYADAKLRNALWTDAAKDLRTDGNGLCQMDDGSTTAWAWYNGARLAACVETSFKGGFEGAEEIAWGWIKWAVECGGRGIGQVRSV